MRLALVPAALRTISRMHLGAPLPRDSRSARWRHRGVVATRGCYGGGRVGFEARGRTAAQGGRHASSARFSSQVRFARAAKVSSLSDHAARGARLFHKYRARLLPSAALPVRGGAVRRVVGVRTRADRRRSASARPCGARCSRGARATQRGTTAVRGAIRTAPARALARARRGARAPSAPARRP